MKPRTFLPPEFFRPEEPTPVDDTRPTFMEADRMGTIVATELRGAGIREGFKQCRRSCELWRQGFRAGAWRFYVLGVIGSAIGVAVGVRLFVDALPKCGP